MKYMNILNIKNIDIVNIKEIYNKNFIKNNNFDCTTI